MDVEHKVTSNTAAIEDVNSNADITDAHGELIIIRV